MTSVPAPLRTPRSTYAGVFVLAFSIILLQIALTRILAVMMWHHLTYMVVSIAMLGFGAAGSLLTARGAGGNPIPGPASLARYGVGYGFAAMFALFFLTNVKFDSLNLWQQPSNFFALLLIYLIITVPFVLGGLGIGVALTRHAQQVNRVYFADLVGSALGGGASAFALEQFAASSVIVFAGAIGVFAGFLFGLAAGVWTTCKNLVLLAVAIAVSIGFAGGAPALRIPALEWQIPFAPNKEASGFDEQSIDARMPSATAEVEVSIPSIGNPAMGGDFGVVDAKPVPQRYVGQDGTAPTAMFENAANYRDFPFLDDTQAASAYRAFAARGATGPEVLVIGVGGGIDVLVALAHDAERIDAAEINSAMIRMLTENYDKYLGGLFRPGAHPFSDRLHLINSEGRSYLRHGDAKYDIIQMSGVDSFTALSTGAYTLSESYLYTVEAVKEFYAHLKDGGYINYSRFFLSYPRPPRETLRLVNIAATALAELGVADPRAQIAVFVGHGWASTMIKRGAFTAPEIAELTAFAEKQQFRGFAFDPLADRGAPYPVPPNTAVVAKQFFAAQVASWSPAASVDQSKVVDALAAALTARLRKATADAELNRAIELLGGDAAVARGQCTTVVETALTVAKPAAEGHWQTRDTYAALLHATPAERAKFVDDYEYDITPCTDDTPFFFNYYKYRGLLPGTEPARALRDQTAYHYDYPVGHAVLVASLGQIVVIAFVLLILPLRRLQRAGVATPQKLRYFVYFGALGMGFMFVEIALMQKLVIFLGHPTYALSIVLTALLGFAGLGSFLGGKLDFGRFLVRAKVLLGIAAAIGGLVLAMNHLLPALLGWPFAARAGITLVLLAPIGLLLGMPFPAGIRLLRENAPQLIPWAWAINGFLSVFSSIFCIVLSMQMGFTNVFLVAAGVYAIGFLLVPGTKRAGVAA